MTDKVVAEDTKKDKSSVYSKIFNARDLVLCPGSRFMPGISSTFNLLLTLIYHLFTFSIFFIYFNG